MKLVWGEHGVWSENPAHRESLLDPKCEGITIDPKIILGRCKDPQVWIILLSCGTFGFLFTRSHVQSSFVFKEWWSQSAAARQRSPMWKNAGCSRSTLSDHSGDI
jgi:hypothetical protein